MQAVEAAYALKPADDLKKMKAHQIVAAVVHDKHVYVFTGGEDPAGKHRHLQPVRIALEGGDPKVIGKAVIGLSVSSTDHSFLTSTAIAKDRLYVGTATDGILVFPWLAPLIKGRFASARQKDCL